MMNSAPLIDLKISGMIAIPAPLNSNFIHIAGMPIHSPPEYHDSHHRNTHPHVRTKLGRVRPDETGSTVCGNCGKGLESETK